MNESWPNPNNSEQKQQQQISHSYQLRVLNRQQTSTTSTSKKFLDAEKLKIRFHYTRQLYNGKRLYAHLQATVINVTLCHNGYISSSYKQYSM